METVNNIAAAASKVIWGEPQETVDAANATIVPETKGTEPLSGELGNTKKGEPYDKGNLDSTSTGLTTPNTSANSDPTITASPSGLGVKSLDTSTSTNKIFLWPTRRNNRRYTYRPAVLIQQ
ncbi:hypothetical protein DID88_003017 [Monilinia fructigena]|uniref:Uncharacterized protein n=1 Tax=Monilinia fructigena TaxID=38457 RepID=A0A395IH56_9HELO|nr:hypothetical protein DID88_003017 [Monilinia fructigena]